MGTITNYVNRIAFILDESGSMEDLKNDVIKVFDNQIKHLAVSSQRMEQETRISVYTFNDSVRNLIWEKDCLRLPSLKGHYNPNGCTALIDATLKVIADYESTPQLYGDYSTVIFCLSDGKCNRNEHLANKLKEKISSLPDNWTVVFLAPDASGIVEAKRYGFPPSNIQNWSVNSKGIEEVGRNISKAMDTFMEARKTGVRGTTNLFNLDASNLTATTVKSKLDELKSSEFELLAVHKDTDIQSFIESWKLPFRKGAGYYMITKKESIQCYKQILIQNKKNGKVYGGDQARKLLGLPNREVKIEPGNFADWNIFCQSSSNNRKLIGGTQLIYIK